MSAPLRRLAVLGIASWLCYLAIALSARSLHISRSGDHALLGQLTLFAAAFGLYLAGVRVVRRASDHRHVMSMVWIGAVLFRLTLLVSDPIEEIDLYRYVWDGAVSTSGVNPFRFTPQQVLAASTNDELPPDLARLVALRDKSPELTEVLKRVHFGELPTIYPPVGQVVFALSSWLTPNGSSVALRMLFMKAWFVAFDLLTIGAVIRVLRQAQHPATDVLIYAWCPLVVKEIANSGHLDSLAVCLTAWAMSFTLSALQAARTERRHGFAWAVAASILLVLGIGAKLYPVVLAPLLWLTVARTLGWRAAMSWAIVFAFSTVAILWPMLPRSSPDASPRFDEQSVVALPDAPPLPPPEVSTAPRDPSESVQAFLSRWEMNDFLFLLVIENLRPSYDLPPEQVAWFTVTPESWRQSFVQGVVARTGLDHDRVPFMATRLMLSVAFVVFACCLAWRATRNRSTAPNRHLHSDCWKRPSSHWLGSGCCCQRRTRGISCGVCRSCPLPAAGLGCC